MSKQNVKIVSAAPAKRNPMAQALASTLYRPRTVKSKKAYSRKNQPRWG